MAGQGSGGLYLQSLCFRCRGRRIAHFRPFWDRYHASVCLRTHIHQDTLIMELKVSLSFQLVLEL